MAALHFDRHLNDFLSPLSVYDTLIITQINKLRFSLLSWVVVFHSPQLKGYNFWKREKQFVSLQNELLLKQREREREVHFKSHCLDQSERDSHCHASNFSLLKIEGKDFLITATQQQRHSNSRIVLSFKGGNQKATCITFVTCCR